MPYVIAGNIASTRIVGIDTTQDFFFQFYAKLSLGLPLTAELIALTPDPYVVRPPKKGSMPAIFGENLGVWTVNEDVKRIIEELEPGVHTFISVNLRVRDKDVDHGRYYLLYVGQALDAIVIDETSFRDGFGRQGFEKSHVLDSLVGPTVLDPKLIKGRHFWRGGRGKIGGGGDPFYRYYFCSNELKTRIKKAKLEGWRFRECKLSKSK